jgi:ankyrin repeat protein
LLKSGADPNFENADVLERTGGFPLHLAVKLNVPRAIEILLMKGASLVRVHEGKTALQLAFENGDEECIAIVCQHISKLEERDS